MLPEIELQKLHQLSKKAFSLLEITVFTLIVAAISIAIMVSENLSSAATSKGVMTEFTKYTQATNNFYKKYNYYPGDFPFSDKFFGTRCDATATNCNGGGNNFVNFITGTTSKNAAGYSEPLLFWRHLNLAGFIEGRYVGKAQGTVNGKKLW